MPHIHTNGRVQTHQIQRGMCPTTVWCNAVAAHVLVNCSSNETRTADSPRRVLVSGDVDFLKLGALQFYLSLNGYFVLNLPSIRCIRSFN